MKARNILAAGLVLTAAAELLPEKQAQAAEDPYMKAVMAQMNARLAEQSAGTYSPVEVKGTKVTPYLPQEQLTNVAQSAVAVQAPVLQAPVVQGDSLGVQTSSGQPQDSLKGAVYGSATMDTTGRFTTNIDTTIYTDKAALTLGLNAVPNPSNGVLVDGVNTPKNSVHSELTLGLTNKTAVSVGAELADGQYTLGTGIAVTIDDKRTLRPNVSYTKVNKVRESQRPGGIAESVIQGGEIIRPGLEITQGKTTAGVRAILARTSVHSGTDFSGERTYGGEVYADTNIGGYPVGGSMAFMPHSQMGEVHISPTKGLQLGVDVSHIAGFDANLERTHSTELGLSASQDFSLFGEKFTVGGRAYSEDGKPGFLASITYRFGEKPRGTRILDEHNRFQKISEAPSDKLMKAINAATLKLAPQQRATVQQTILLIFNAIADPNTVVDGETKTLTFTVQNLSAVFANAAAAVAAMSVIEVIDNGAVNWSNMRVVDFNAGTMAVDYTGAAGVGVDATDTNRINSTTGQNSEDFDTGQTAF